MLLMIESGIRGGIATISHRHAKAINEYMGTDFNPIKESKFAQRMFHKFITEHHAQVQEMKPCQTKNKRSNRFLLGKTQLDANNLYVWAMSKQLPASGFEWMTDDELDDWKYLSCFLVVDLEYANDLHDLYNDYPLAPEIVKIGYIEKLIPILNNKANYVVNYENLKLYECLCLKNTKIHKGIKFEESAWMEEYINLNTKLRVEAKQSGNNFEVDFFQTSDQFCLWENTRKYQKEG